MSDLTPAEMLPTDLGDSTQEDFEALGFIFGEPDPADPMFRPATLPSGWKREASEDDMWSYVVDQLGRRRVNVFYKAAFDDRRASMHIRSVAIYVNGCAYGGTEVITDDSWTTPAAVLEAARKGVTAWMEYEKNVDHVSDGSADETKARREAYEALVVRFEKVGQA